MGEKVYTFGVLFLIVFLTNFATYAAETTSFPAFKTLDVQWFTKPMNVITPVVTPAIKPTGTIKRKKIKRVRE
jgi:hypothetical protein